MPKTVKAKKALDVYYIVLEIWVRARHLCTILYGVGLRSLAQLGLKVQSWGHLDSEGTSTQACWAGWAQQICKPSCWPTDVCLLTFSAWGLCFPTASSPQRKSCLTLNAWCAGAEPVSGASSSVFSMVNEWRQHKGISSPMTAHV